MSFNVDVSDLEQWTAHMRGAGPRLQSELAKRTRNLLAQGAGIMRILAPRMTGRLAGSIGVTRSVGLSGSFGTSLVYARIRNFGGVIRARNAPFLVFQVGGRWIRTKQVVQTGTHYLERTVERLRPIVQREYRFAVAAALGRGGR